MELTEEVVVWENRRSAVLVFGFYIVYRWMGAAVPGYWIFEGIVWL